MYSTSLTIVCGSRVVRCIGICGGLDYGQCGDSCGQVLFPSLFDDTTDITASSGVPDLDSSDITLLAVAVLVCGDVLDACVCCLGVARTSRCLSVYEMGNGSGYSSSLFGRLPAGSTAGY